MLQKMADNAIFMNLSFLKDVESYGIIGTAGRGSDESKMTLETYRRMVKIAEELIGERPVDLSSGGAPWADHVAVNLFLHSKIVTVDTLTIEFPCLFEDGGYVHGEIYDGYDIAKVSEHYHYIFKDKTGIDSIKELQQAIDQGARPNFSKGFFDRNCKVATADKMIAFTYGNRAKLKDGGTAHTARCYIENGGRHLYHVNLNNWKVYDLNHFP